MKYSQKYRLCQCCEELSNTVKKRRMNTRYQNDKLNYMFSCSKCFKLQEADWAADWKDYWSGCL